MKLIGKGGLSKVLEVLLLILMCLAPLVMASLPWTIPLISGKRPGEYMHFYEKYLVILLISGIVAECILWQGRAILHNVNRGLAFTPDTVKRLKICGIECLVLGVIWGISLLLVTKIFVAAILVTFTVVGMLLLVLSELFRQAVAYKDENDMTI